LAYNTKYSFPFTLEKGTTQLLVNNNIRLPVSIVDEEDVIDPKKYRPDGKITLVLASL
jgi:hypothetical protein